MSFGKAWVAIQRQENKKMANDSLKYLKQIEGLMRGHTGSSFGNIDIPKVKNKSKIQTGAPKDLYSTKVKTKVPTSKVHHNTLKRINKKFAKDMKKMGVGYSGTTDYEV